MPQLDIHTFMMAMLLSLSFNKHNIIKKFELSQKLFQCL
jgi:hypothetical protein